MPTSEVQPTDRVRIRQGFEWDAQDAYLFDIDGTLMWSRDRIHFNSVADSIRQVTGFEVTLNAVLIHGGTDTSILQETLTKAGVPRETWEPQMESILDAMRQTVSSRRHELDLMLMPAVRETLTHLADRGALLGVATGNLEMIGWIKVEEAGLRKWFRFGGFSDKFPVRAAMVGDAVTKARELLGPELAAEASICVVGDTPRDIEAARANNLAVIAVATGHYSFDELARLEPDVCASSLAALLSAAAGDL
jgi:phosphoglycolate phosphatase-like HAD superfamily hydrolase